MGAVDAEIGVACLCPPPDWGHIPKPCKKKLKLTHYPQVTILEYNEVLFSLFGLSVWQSLITLCGCVGEAMAKQVLSNIIDGRPHGFNLCGEPHPPELQITCPPTQKSHCY